MKYNIQGTFEKNYSSYLHDEPGEETTLNIRIPHMELMRKVLWFAESDLYIEDRPDILELMSELKNALAKRIKDYERVREIESHMRKTLDRNGFELKAKFIEADYEF